MLVLIEWGHAEDEKGFANRRNANINIFKTEEEANAWLENAYKKMGGYLIVWNKEVLTDEEVLGTIITK